MRTRIARFAAGFMALALLLGGLGALSLDTAKAALTLTVSDKYAVKDGTFTVTIVDTETSGVTDGTAASPTTVSVKVKNKNRGVTATMTPQDAGTDAKTFTMTVTVKEQAAAVTTVGSDIIPGFEGDTIEKYLMQRNKKKKIAQIWTDFDESQRPEGENKEDWIEILDYDSKKKLYFKIPMGENKTSYSN